YDDGSAGIPFPVKTPGPDSATILLVDDEDAVQKLLTYPLEHEGFRVLQARDGEEALQRFAGEHVDLVVLDLMLPKLDGLEVCRRLRALLRRAAAGAHDGGRDRIVVEELVLDLAKRTTQLADRAVELTYVEFELLRTLAERPGRVFSRQALLQSLWGDYAYREPRTIDVHVRHLREKLGDMELIQTVRGVGYRLRG